MRTTTASPDTLVGYITAPGASTVTNDGTVNSSAYTPLSWHSMRNLFVEEGVWATAAAMAAVKVRNGLSQLTPGYPSFPCLPT